MVQRLKVDVCVIGGGSAGLSVAAGASQMGADTVLIEGGKMGGDCLNYGCIPSKAVATHLSARDYASHLQENTGAPVVTDDRAGRALPAAPVQGENPWFNV